MGESFVIRPLGNGATQRGVREHNERLILTLLQRYGQLPGSELARGTQLSAQTVSVIMRKLEADGLLIKGDPVKGRVGKPSVPMALNPDGAASIGFKLGRRSSDFFLTDLCGKVLMRRNLRYDIALPETIFGFMSDGVDAARDLLGEDRAARLTGIGIAAPFEIWKWGASDGNTPDAFLSWKDVAFEEQVARFTDLPVFVVNDATSACWAEHLYGRGKDLRNYAYFFVSTFIGGGVVLNGSVYEGARGNAGAFGPLRVGDRAGRTRQLLDAASIYLLERKLVQAGHDPRQIWELPQEWDRFDVIVDEWVDETAHAIAQACTSVCAVIDFETVIIDGYFPEDVRTRLVERVAAHLQEEDTRGLILPRVIAGEAGLDARGIGAACIPLFSQFFLSTNVGYLD